jgi:hypothetical protein
MYDLSDNVISHLGLAMLVHVAILLQAFFVSPVRHSGIIYLLSSIKLLVRILSYGRGTKLPNAKHPRNRIPRRSLYMFG